MIVVRETWKQVFLKLFFSIFLIQNKFVHKSFFNVILREEKKREIKFFQAKKIGTLWICSFNNFRNKISHFLR